MTTAEERTDDTHAFQADVAKLLHMMVHSVYSDRDVFLRELISNAADACERLRYEAIASPDLLSDDTLRISLTIDADNRCLSVEDNGIGMNHEELIQALGSTEDRQLPVCPDVTCALQRGVTLDFSRPTGLATRYSRPRRS